MLSFTRIKVAQNKKKDQVKKPLEISDKNIHSN